ncbi:AlpA family phage regulatory protein [Micromonospora sp. NPDC048999]|uniref:helix-turn-helix transcriptional regulator n=1 Tax=Micromonospora sp. NPDC048999 TaxID=3155391 RepID=UPI0033EFFC11
MSLPSRGGIGSSEQVNSLHAPVRMNSASAQRSGVQFACSYRRRMGKLRLVASQEVQEMLGVSRTRAYQITNSKSFPDPVAVLSVGRIWQAEDVERWIRDHRPNLQDAE